MTLEPFEAGGFTVISNVIDNDQCDVLASRILGFEKIGAGSRALLSRPCIRI
jgi:hypothetical protein